MNLSKSRRDVSAPPPWRPCPDNPSLPLLPPAFSMAKRRGFEKLQMDLFIYIYYRMLVQNPNAA